MGKKARKTRWRTLAITSGEQSDSEESNSQSGQQQISKSYPQKPYYSKFPYSSQSTPVRTRFQNDTKSTRSSSTTSENKITFNEDEYTKITTPRQDVLFKKGYLSKPKTYQTQTSTGNSTVSTGNSTGNGTPDHQSADGTEGTDLEYESQFVFPNGYVDPNGIYYINSFEPYPPLVVYNAPYCYPEYPITRSKRYSTDSLTESTSPHNEETSQDQSQSGGETFEVSEQTKPLVNGHNCEDDDVTAQQDSENAEQRKVKKRRRRKLSKPVPDGTSSDDGDELVNRIAEEQTASKKVELKPDAKEFIPRAYQNVHFIPNFIPLPLISELHPAFLPPGIPINFIPPDKIVHNYVNFIPNYVPKVYETQPEEVEEEVEEKPEGKEENYKSNIDIEKIVSKLEEAAKEQRFYENRKQKYSPHKFNNKKKFTPEKKPLRKPDIVEVNKPETCSSALSKPNYAETLLKKKKIDKPLLAEPVKSKPPVAQNQWISVSRKKRRNKNAIEEIEIVDVQACKEEEFEAYDVEKLQDVIVPSVECNETVPEVEERLEEIAQEMVDEVVEQKPSECDEIEELIRSLEEIEAKTNLLKRRNKSAKTRRVIITDMDLSQSSHIEDDLGSPVKNIKDGDVKLANFDPSINTKTVKQKNVENSNNDTKLANLKNEFKIDLNTTRKVTNVDSKITTNSKCQKNGGNSNSDQKIQTNAKKQINGENSNVTPKSIKRNDNSSIKPIKEGIKNAKHSNKQGSTDKNLGDEEISCNSTNSNDKVDDCSTILGTDSEATKENRIQETDRIKAHEKNLSRAKGVVSADEANVETEDISENEVAETTERKNLNQDIQVHFTKFQQDNLIASTRNQQNIDVNLIIKQGDDEDHPLKNIKENNQGHLMRNQGKDADDLKITNPEIIEKSKNNVEQKVVEVTKLPNHVHLKKPQHNNLVKNNGDANESNDNSCREHVCNTTKTNNCEEIASSLSKENELHTKRDTKTTKKVDNDENNKEEKTKGNSKASVNENNSGIRTHALNSSTDVTTNGVDGMDALNALKANEETLTRTGSYASAAAVKTKENSKVVKKDASTTDMKIKVESAVETTLTKRNASTIDNDVMMNKTANISTAVEFNGFKHNDMVRSNESASIITKSNGFQDVKNTKKTSKSSVVIETEDYDDEVQVKFNLLKDDEGKVNFKKTKLTRTLQNQPGNAEKKNVLETGTKTQQTPKSDFEGTASISQVNGFSSVSELKHKFAKKNEMKESRVNGVSSDFKIRDQITIDNSKNNEHEESEINPKKDFEETENVEQENGFKVVTGQRKQKQQKKASVKNSQSRENGFIRTSEESNQTLATDSQNNEELDVLNNVTNNTKLDNEVGFIFEENKEKLVVQNECDTIPNHPEQTGLDQTTSKGEDLLSEVVENSLNLVNLNPKLKVKDQKSKSKPSSKNIDLEFEDGETLEKKRTSKKKKKSSVKSKPISTRNFDETYDFLLNNTFQENEKTNVEISEELSKIIQRGMYSSLEEKIKSLNITAANDGFFKTITYADTTEKRNDLTNVVNTSNLFKPKRSIEDIDLTKLKLPSLEPSVSGSFLDLSNEQKDPGIAKDSHYPITQAVKDWMTKTRETTPEVEILKSPSTILKEALQNGDDPVSEEEEVIFSKDWSLTPENSFEEDLLEWDDEIEAKNGKIDVGEDVLEVYESKYGKNEDYAKIKAEIEEKKRNGTFPKHANLPYRAICCSLM